MKEHGNLMKDWTILTWVFFAWESSDVVLKYIKKIWEYILGKNEINKCLNEMEADKKCNCAWCNVFNYTLFFLIFQTLMRIMMLGIIFCKLYTDVFGSIEDTSEGDYRVEGWSWFIIVAGWYFPMVSWLAFFFINMYCFRRPIHLHTNRETDVWISTDLRFFGVIHNPCAIFFIYVLLVTFVLFHFGGTNPQGETNNIPDGLNTAWGIFFLLFDLF